MLSQKVSITHAIWTGNLYFISNKSMGRILLNQFKHFHKNDRFDISDICLCVSTERCHFKQRT